MKVKRIAKYILLIAGIFMLAMTVLPHHHHHNELPCFRLWEQHHACDNERHQHNENTCENHCAANFEKTVITTPTGNHSAEYLSPAIIILFKEIIPGTDLHLPLFSTIRFIPYLEHLHGIHISRSLGLRGPPAHTI